MTFAAEVKGVERVVHAGDLLSATDPVVKGRVELFEAAAPIERARAAPGERRKR